MGCRYSHWSRYSSEICVSRKRRKYKDGKRPFLTSSTYAERPLASLLDWSTQRFWKQTSYLEMALSYGSCSNTRGYSYCYTWNKKQFLTAFMFRKFFITRKKVVLIECFDSCYTRTSIIVRTKIESEACQWTPQNALPLTACSLPLFWKAALLLVIYGKKRVIWPRR